MGFGNTTGGGEAITTDAPRAAERADLCEVSTTDAPTAGEDVDPREAGTTEPATDPPCGREGRTAPGGGTVLGGLNANTVHLI